VGAGVPHPATAARTAYLGLGSNVGDRRAHLQAAADALPGEGVAVLASSSVYETEPVGEVTEQPDFLNACLRTRTSLDPEELLRACKRVESDVGREPGGPRHGPRAIDVDVLLVEGVAHDSASLHVPHPEIATRRFVLVPLLELDPDLSLGGVVLADALASLPAGQAVRVAGAPLRTAG
jgi:2-amino-4-hydroxy-6-hydroxymethyldihydropteridine diphosphokinase